MDSMTTSKLFPVSLPYKSYIVEQVITMYMYVHAQQTMLLIQTHVYTYIKYGHSTFLIHNIHNRVLITALYMYI